MARTSELVRELAILVVMQALTATAHAQSPAPDLGIERPQVFVLADTSGNQCLELAEVAAVMAWRFAALDRNRDQALDESELQNPEQGRFTKLDTDGNGKLDFGEVMVGKTSDFRAADADRSGCLAIGEVVDYDTRR